MKIETLPYYVNYVFIGEDGNQCISTTDIRLIKDFIRYANGEPIYSIEIGDSIYFLPNETDIFEITDIKVQQIVDDTDILQYGVDLDNCTQVQGTQKQHLFKILFRMKLKK